MEHADPVRPSTYGQILKSSVLIGGSSAFNVAVGIVRTKAMALLLGPAGFGLMGLYTSIVNLAQVVAGMGINSSGVRQIAAAVGSSDPRSVPRTAAVLRRSAVALGLLGGVLLAVLSGPVSRLTFGTAERAAAVAVLSLAVVFKSVSDGQVALVQGLRRIADLAKISVLGGTAGAVASVALVYALGERGVAPALVVIAAGSLAFSWWYSGKAGVARVALKPPEVAREAGGLLRLGFAFMASGMLMMGAAYAVRIMVVRGVGFEAAGLYQSAWTVGGLYVGFILQAMGADFYPRLTAAVRDRAECNRLVNEQTEVGLLLAGPGIVATLALAPLVVSTLYSSAFGAAVQVLRWICLGATFQVITWPMGFIIVAEGRQGIFLWSEVAYAVVHVGAAWALVGRLGVDGAGLAFFASYVFHLLIVYPIVRRMTGFRFTKPARRLVLGYLAFIGVVFGSFHVLPPAVATATGAVAAAAGGVYSLRTLLRLVPPGRLPPGVRLLAQRIGLAGRAP